MMSELIRRHPSLGANSFAVLMLVLALFKKTPSGHKLPFWNINFHRNLGVLACSALTIHAALSVAAVSIRKDYFVYGLLIANFNNGFYAFADTLGVLALYGLLLVMIGGYFR